MPDDVKLSSTSIFVPLSGNVASGAERLVGAVGTDPSADNFSITLTELANFIALNSIIKSVKVTISSAEILNLFSATKTLIAAPGSGKVIVPHTISAYFIPNTTPYNTNTQVNFNLSSVIASTSSIFLASASNRWEQLALALLQSNASNINTPLLAKAVTANPIGGDGTMAVYITYAILTI